MTCMTKTEYTYQMIYLLKLCITMDNFHLYLERNSLTYLLPVGQNLEGLAALY